MLSTKTAQAKAVDVYQPMVRGEHLSPSGRAQE
jgi:hypothetical protein